MNPSRACRGSLGSVWRGFFAGRRTGRNGRPLSERHPHCRVRAVARQAFPRQAGQGRRSDRRLGMCLARRRRPDRRTEQSAVGRREPDRFLPPAGRIARPLPICQGQQSLPDDQPVRVGLVGGSPFRPRAVAARPRGGAGGPRSRDEGDPQSLGNVARVCLQGTRALGG